MILTVGKQRIASVLANGSLATHLAIGTDDTDENAADLSLGAEIHRVALETFAASDKTVYGVGKITASDIGGSSYAIKEVGLFDQASGGNCICRIVLDTAITITGAQQFWGLIGIVNE